MSKWEVLLKLSHEARQWAHYLIPLAFVIGKHLPQPKYMRKKDP